MGRTGKRTLQSEASAAFEEENETRDETKGMTSRDDDNGKRKKLKLDDAEVSGKRTCCLGKGEGKKKVEGASSDQTGKQVCVICLYEGKRRNIGTLDCCSHHFCFTCINKWAKIESRCPLCKKRFRAINKHVKYYSKEGSEPKVIQVPERDQVPDIIDETLPVTYLMNICTECHHGGLEGHMLHCSSCGSAAHFHCARHGHEIPGGGWNCSTCQPLAGVPLFDFQNQLFGDERPIRVPVVEYSAITGAWEPTVWEQWFL